MGLFSRGIPFEMAQPGTDPTRIPNSATSRRRGIQFGGDVMLVVGVVGFLVFGYVKFIHKPAAPSSPPPPPTAISTPTPQEAEGSGMFGGGEAHPFAQGFFPQGEERDSPTETPSTPTPTPMPTPEPTPEPTKEHQRPRFTIDLHGTEETCVCTPRGAIMGVPECWDAVPEACIEFWEDNSQ